MPTPFIYGKIVQNESFTDRENETGQLVFNFSSTINTILISPRRWGKSSLVAKAAAIATAANPNLRFCFIDIYNVRTEDEFYQLLAQEVLKSSSSKMEELLEDARNFLGKFIPRVTFNPDPSSEISLGLDWKEVKRQPDDILNLADNIAKAKNLKFVICIDEFQNISGFDDHLAVQKKLRSHWQKQVNVSYCLYGSKRHMLMDVFSSPSMPFYKFGDILFLQKISKTDWIPFIKGRFLITGKEISDQNAELITGLVESHSQYVQQLAQQVWFRTDKSASEAIVHEAHENLILQLSMLFQTITDGLSNTQLNFLKAILHEAIQLSSKDTIQEFGLGTSANVLRIKQALISKEIIDIQGDNIEFIDPLFKYWLKKHYFKI